ncbi:MAG: hypothetical protein ACLF0G_04800 [Candidatus Brocadiia bacterium]
MVRLTKAIEKFVLFEHKQDGMAGFVVLLGKNNEENQKTLTELAEEHKLSIPLTLPASGKDPAKFKLNKDVPVTVLVYKNKRVHANFALTDPPPKDEEAQAKEVEQVLDAASEMLK